MSEAKKRLERLAAAQGRLATLDSKEDKVMFLVRFGYGNGPDCLYDTGVERDGLAFFMEQTLQRIELQKALDLEKIRAEGNL